MYNHPIYRAHTCWLNPPLFSQVSIVLEGPEWICAAMQEVVGTTRLALENHAEVEINASGFFFYLNFTWLQEAFAAPSALQDVTHNQHRAGSSPTMHMNSSRTRCNNRSRRKNKKQGRESQVLIPLYMEY